MYKRGVVNTALPYSCSSKITNYEVFTNGFWDNWFVSAGGDTKDIREKLNAMGLENQRLSALQAKSRLAEVAKSQVTRIDTLNMNTVSPVIVIFPIGKTVLSQDMHVNLSFFAQQLKLDYKGGVANLFYNNPALSRATITKAE